MEQARRGTARTQEGQPRTNPEAAIAARAGTVAGSRDEACPAVDAELTFMETGERMPGRTAVAALLRRLSGMTIAPTPAAAMVADQARPMVEADFSGALAAIRLNAPLDALVGQRRDG
jgi:hypothetical protein